LDTLAGKKETSASFSAGITVPMVQSNVTLQLAWIDADRKGSTSDLTFAIQEVSDFLAQQSTGKEGISFALSGETVVGVLLAPRFSSRVPLRQSSKTLLLKSRTEVSRTAF